MANNAELKVLLVEDDIASLALLRKILSYLEFTDENIMVAHDSKEALDFWKDNQGWAHLLITDFWSAGGKGGGNGIDFMKRLNIPTVVATALHVEEYTATNEVVIGIERYQKPKNSEFLEKHSLVTQLQPAVDKVLSRSTTPPSFNSSAENVEKPAA